MRRDAGCGASKVNKGCPRCWIWRRPSCKAGRRASEGLLGAGWWTCEAVECSIVGVCAWEVGGGGRCSRWPLPRGG